MCNVAICRVCLAIDVRLYSMINTPLQEIYEKITNIPLSVDERKPDLVCHMCRARLHRSLILMTRALNADQILTQLLQSGIELCPPPFIDRPSYHLADGYCISPIEHFSTIHVEDSVIDNSAVKVEPVKCEDGVQNEKNIEENDVKEVLNEGNNDDKAVGELDHQSDCLPHHSSSDSDDDVPLQTFSNKKRTERKVNVRRVNKRKWVRKTEDKFEKGFTADFAKEIILTKEEQIQELEVRAKSLNYLNSPLKCEMCYKGFVDVRAYENHRRKHDESSGTHECEICRMRYSTGRQLRTHAHTSHSRRYQCGRCSHQSHTANQAREHEKWHSGYTYECKLCGQAFRKPTSYLTHMRKRHPTQHVCNICGESFVGRHGLLMHKSKTHVGDKRTEDPSEPAAERFCVECNIQFANLDAWKTHILTSAKHTLANEVSPQCKICAVRFPSTSLLSLHLKEHQKSLKASKAIPVTFKPTAELACDQCDSNFVNRSKLQAHIKRKHLGLKYNKNIVCEVCGKKCTSNASLRYHQRTHTGERPYGCAACGKRFADNNQLRIHTRTHTGERPYCCAACGKRFSQKPALNRHYRVHTGAKPYICQFCSKPFSQSNSLKLHVKTVHLKMPPNKRNKQDETATLKVEDNVAVQNL